MQCFYLDSKAGSEILRIVIENKIVYIYNKHFKCIMTCSLPIMIDILKHLIKLITI